MGSSLAHDVGEAQRHKHRRNSTSDEALQQSVNQTKSKSEYRIWVGNILPDVNTYKTEIQNQDHPQLRGGGGQPPETLPD
jgi:hypothetical protein